VRSWILTVLLIGTTLAAQTQTAPSSEGAGTASAEPARTSATPSSKTASSKTTVEQTQDDANDRGVRLRSLPKNILQDQRALFTSPFRMSGEQWKLAVPLSLLAVGLVASDTAMEAHVTRSSSTASHATTLSNAGLGGLLGVGGGMYVWGALVKNEQRRETGFLSGEAALDAYLDTTLIKFVAGRDRPFTANGRGNFFDGGSSFTSQHAAVSWAVASVIAHEYPGVATQVLSYGLAGAVSAARVEGQKHFMSDAVIGSAIGWYIGRQVYRARSSDADIDVHNWGKFERNEHSEEDEATGKMGSSYVPLDSWVYEAFDRLAALGYVRTGSATIRPWTRLECARLLRETHDAIDAEEAEEEDPITTPLLEALDEELTHEKNLMDGGRNSGAQVESLYGRFTGISGTPLRDSMHFAQTLVDDYGRPYGQGANGIGGVSGRTEAGPFALYVRGEYQYASAIPEYSASTQQALAAPVRAGGDGLPYGWNLRFGTTSRFRPVEAYASLNLSDWQLSFGQQSLWWGPDRSTSMILSNNAEAMPMLRLARVAPMKLPGLLSGLGPVHFDSFFAREGGVHYVCLTSPSPLDCPVPTPHGGLHGDAAQALDPPPYMWGVSFSIKPTENFELGFGHTTIFAGYGRPLNLKTFIHTFSILGNGQAVDPGKRTTEFNFSYHVPGLRKWLVIYSEAFAYNNPLEGTFAQRFAVNPGIYVPQLPGWRKLDLRVEGVNTNLPGLKDPAYFYMNLHYPQGYTNYGQIIGSWIGRQGSGGQASSTYWFSARNKASVSYRRMVADKTFLQGGQLDDISGSITWLLRPGVEVSAMSQYESWKFPLLTAGARSDVSTSFEVRLFPKLRVGSGSSPGKR
jgi:membrane-associated phospholipid phosphatase